MTCGDRSAWRVWGLGAMGAAASLGLAAATAHSELASLSLPAVGLALYNRVQRDGSFENETRRRIFDYVRNRPGQSIAEIATTVGVSHSTASYHLERLMEFNLLASTQDGNKMRFFVNGGLFTEEERRVLAALSNGETRRVLATILANPGSYRAELTNLLHVSSPRQEPLPLRGPGTPARHLRDAVLEGQGHALRRGRHPGTADVLLAVSSAALRSRLPSFLLFHPSLG
jgi:DNA-binding transcriptional ArsR family regulator